MNLSEEEQQLIALIRSQSAGDEVKLLIERDDDTWHVTVSVPPHHERASYGRGESFGEAWTKAGPMWAKGPQARVGA